MVKKTASPAVQKAVSKATAETPVESAESEAKTRGAKQFTSQQYVAEYLAEVALENGTWESLCKRTGFNLANVRQCITNLRSEYRATMLEKANGSPDFLKSLAKAKKDVEVWADERAADKFPYFKNASTRNTEKAKMRSAWENEELSL